MGNINNIDFDHKHSMKVKLKPIEESIISKNLANQYPINFINFSILMDMTNGARKPGTIVKEFTFQIKKKHYLYTFDKNYQLLQHRTMKTRFTKLKKSP